ncbi:MAG: 50S ribosome-binding GTPase [Candidatus Aenigmarchaeota archaeon]|nr:50S ribosome-binding GTPase [Candidatus Aenigmarchaeota archaeon]
MSEYNKIANYIKDSDFVIELVDARCPFLYHIPQLPIFSEKFDKEFLVVITKCELIPSGHKKTIAKKFNERNINVFFVSAKKRDGILRLASLLKSRAKDRQISVILFGLPNAGKSTLANALISKHSAGTSPVPGHTRGIQFLKMSKNVMLHDTKGITNIKKYSELESALFSKNPENVFFLVEKLLEANNGNLDQYGVDLPSCKKEAELFLEKFAKEKNFIFQNNIIDIHRAKGKIISDWHKGKLTGWWID